MSPYDGILMTDQANNIISLPILCNEDGFYLGSNTVQMLIIQSVLLQISVVILKFVPLPAQVPPDGFALFALCFVLGLFTLFFR